MAAPKPISEFERELDYAHKLVDELAGYIRRARKGGKAEEVRYAAMIAANESRGLASVLEGALVALPPSPTWVVAQRVQELRDKEWDHGAVVFDPVTFANPIYVSGDVPDGMAAVPLRQAVRCRNDRKHEIELLEIVVGREAAKVRERGGES